jgi:hypothetical protein
MVKKSLLFLLSISSFFVSSINAQNLGLKWAKEFDSLNDLYLTDIESDAQSNIYIIGQFSAPVDMDPGPGNFTLNSLGDEDIFVAKYTSSGAFVWANSFGGAGTDLANSIAVNDVGDVALLFQTEGYIDLNPNSPGTEFTFPNDGTVLVALNYSGGYYASKVWNGSTNYQDNSNQIVVDNSGNTYIFDTPDSKLIKYDYFFNLVWQKSIDIVDAQSIVCDDFGNIYLASYITGSGYMLPDNFEGYYTAAGDDSDILVSKFSTDGALLWQGAVGSINHEDDARLETDGQSSLFLSYSANGPTQSGILSPGSLNPYYGYSDVVLSCYNLSGGELWTNVLPSESSTALTYQAQTNEIFIGISNFPGDGGPIPGTTSTSGPIYGFSATNGVVTSWGERFMRNPFNGGTQTFHYSPYLKALENGTLIAGDRWYLSLDVQPGYANSDDFYSEVGYNVFLASYGFCSSTNSTLNVEVCYDEVYSFNGESLNAGTHEFYYVNQGGCDSVVTVNVNELPYPPFVSRYLVICGSSYEYGGSTYTASGDYLNEWVNENGCLDSTVSLVLQFVTAPYLTIVPAGSSYYLYATGVNWNGSYVFYNCDNNEIVQQGLTTLLITDIPGNYRVEFIPNSNDPWNANGCSVSSECVFVGLSNTNNLEHNDLRVYPNPISRHGSLTIDKPNNNFRLVTISDLAGRIVYSSNKFTPILPLSSIDLRPGLYELNLISDKEQHRVPLIIE